MLTLLATIYHDTAYQLDHSRTFKNLKIYKPPPPTEGYHDKLFPPYSGTNISSLFILNILLVSCKLKRGYFVSYFHHPMLISAGLGMLIT